MKPISNAPKDPIARQEVQEASNPEFTEASTRENIQSEEPLSTLFGKIKKFFTDLKTVAFSGSYNDLSNTPSLGTAAAKDVANSGDASTSQVVMGNDSRLTDARTPTSHTHSYAGSSSAGGAATSAEKLTNTSKVGDTNKPVYFTANGVPAAISYTIDKSVPSDAVFTDHYAWGDITGKPSSYTPASHTHGNIQNGGTLQTNDITIASGDKIVVTDSSDSSKIARTSISFDGSTTTQCLTKKGTWATFGTSNLTIGTSSSTAAAGNHNHDSTYLKLSGGNITGNLNIGSSGAGGYLNGSATNGGCNSIMLGDDVWLGDVNLGGIMGMKSTGANCGFRFLNSSGTNIGTLQSANGTLTFNDQTIIHSGNIGSQAVASATKATQDGSGNTITSTYLKKSGDSMTGGYLDVYYNNTKRMSLYSNNSIPENYLIGWSGKTVVYSNDGTGVDLRCDTDNNTSGVRVTSKAANAWKTMYALAFSSQSSRLAKENIIPFSDEDGLKLLELEPVHFDYKECMGGQKNNVGLIAEDVYEVLPNTVNMPEDYDPDNFDEAKSINNSLPSIDYSKYVPYLIKLCQVQQKEIDDLKVEIAALKTE